MDERLKKVLVVYSTLSGCTETHARRIGVDLIAYRVRPLVVSVEQMPNIPDDVDAVIFGSGVRIAKFHKEGREWLLNNAAALNGKPLALFSVGLHAVPAADGNIAQAERDFDAAMAAVGGKFEPISSVEFPGWKRSEGFSAMEKLALRVYPLEDGDYRDWNKVDAWVREVAPRLVGNNAHWGHMW